MCSIHNGDAQILIIDGKVYLTLGPPLKDPTNYFWTVLMDLQSLARTVKLPDTELLLNFAGEHSMVSIAW